MNRCFFIANFSLVNSQRYIIIIINAAYVHILITRKLKFTGIKRREVKRQFIFIIPLPIKSAFQPTEERMPSERRRSVYCTSSFLLETAEEEGFYLWPHKICAMRNFTQTNFEIKLWDERKYVRKQIQFKAEYASRKIRSNKLSLFNFILKWIAICLNRI